MVVDTGDSCHSLYELVIMLMAANRFEILPEQSLLDDSRPAVSNGIDFGADSAENDLLNLAALQPAAFIADASLDQPQPTPRLASPSASTRDASEESLIVGGRRRRRQRGATASSGGAMGSARCGA